jgi:hypothetical protein
VPIRPFDKPSLGLDHPLLQRVGSDTPIRGIYLTDHGPMLIASRPMITSDHRRPVRGALIMGHLLGPMLTEHLRNKTQVNLRMWPLGDVHMAQEAHQVLQKIDARTPVYIRTIKHDLQVYTILPGVAGTPGLLLRADVSRQITSKGLAVIKYAVVSDALVTIAMLIVFLGLLQHTVVQPLSALTRCAVGIGAGEDPTPGCVSDRDDEIGILGREFERMVHRLRATHQGLLREIDQHCRSRAMLDTYHQKLRRLSSALLLAEEEERRRIAVELHDRIGQSLTVSKMRLDTLAAGRPESQDVTHIREIAISLERTIADTRMLPLELRTRPGYPFSFRHGKLGLWKPQFRDPPLLPLFELAYTRNGLHPHTM